MTQQEALFEYTLRLGDTSLILGHRMSEWCGHGPKLEQDIALINIALDLVGQARSYLEYAGKIEGKGRDEDKLAYFREERDFKNLLIAERPNGDWGHTIMRSFLFDTFHYFFLHELVKSKDEQLAAIAAKSLKEVTYHLRHNSEWVIRLGDGTEESRQRMVDALDELWMYTGEMFGMDDVDQQLIDAGIAPDLSLIRPLWQQKVKETLAEATLEYPGDDAWMQSGGKLKGIHTEHMGYILAEMQHLPRCHPEATW